MKLKDRIRFVRQNMSKTKSRIFMTVLATAMGCAFLIVLASVGFGLQQSMVDQIVGDRTVTEIQVYGREQPGGTDRDLKDSDLSMFRALPNVKAVTTRQYVNQRLLYTFNGEQEPVGGPTAVVDLKSELLAGLSLEAGRAPETADEIVVGHHFRSRFMTDKEPLKASGDQSTPAPVPDAKEWLNQTLTFSIANPEGATKEFTVKIVGITTPPSREWIKDTNAYLGQELLTSIESFTGTLYGELPVKDKDAPAPAAHTEPRSYNEVRIIADHMKHVKGISSEIRSQGYMNYSIADELENVNVIFAIMNIGLIFVGTIAVLIASIGIYNTMSMAVTERTQDIGIIKAIGGHPSTIRSIFLLECGLIGLMGAAIGTLVSYGISIGVNSLMPVIIKQFMNEKVPEGFMFSRIPYYLTLISVGISLGVAVLSGYRPAVRATRIDVLKALRRDI